MTCGICATKKLVRHSIDEYEMTNVFWHAWPPISKHDLYSYTN